MLFQTLDQHKAIQKEAHDVSLRLLFPEQFPGDPLLDGLSERAAKLIRAMAQEIWTLKRIPNEVVNNDGNAEQATAVEELDYTVRIEVRVTANSPEQAAIFAIEDLRDESLGPWSADVLSLRGTQVVQSIASPTSVNDVQRDTNRPKS